MPPLLPIVQPTRRFLSRYAQLRSTGDRSDMPSIPAHDFRPFNDNAIACWPTSRSRHATFNAAHAKDTRRQKTWRMSALICSALALLLMETCVPHSSFSGSS